MNRSGPTLVTGAYGLIGHAVVTALVARGLPVVPTDLLPSPPSDAVFSALLLPVNGVAALSEFMTTHRIARIVHCAAISGPMLAQDQPHTVFTTNAGGTLDLFEAARLTGVNRIVLLSSASVYGRTGDETVTEGAPLGATGVYGTSKIVGELIARAYSARHAVDAVILRPSWVYGPRRRTACVIRAMISDALAGRSTRFAYGHGFPRQFVHVDDVASAVVAALFVDAGAGRALNLSDGTRPSLDEVADIVRSILPDADIEMTPGEDPDDEYLGQLDLSEVRRRLDWRPTIDLTMGITSYVNHLARSDRSQTP